MDHFVPVVGAVVGRLVEYLNFGVETVVDCSVEHLISVMESVVDCFVDDLVPVVGAVDDRLCQHFLNMWK